MASGRVTGVLRAGIFLFSLPALYACAGQAQPAKGIAAQAVVNPGIVKYSPSLSASSLAKRPDTDLVELSNGSRIRLGDVRRLRGIAQNIRATAPGSRLPKAFRARPASTGTKLTRAADLTAALKLPDSATVVLPSGRRATVGMIRLLQPEVEARLGRPLSAGPVPVSLSGPVVKVDAKTDWKTILTKPDGTVLEAPDGKRITVGELKQVLAASSQTRILPPAGR